ncbi:hypothetical protein D0Z08_25895 [Nocardioides immobilis]|uniref:Uncharacterized protein n=1 Tax=Nocardioides immobilis TaxID=2049295 RepID=A0A417XV33_9ACTN|nr:hypothetical protein D0Z08_25895 [Nocardioides immobilis]
MEVSWSDSPLAPMATINGRLSSWARWLVAEGLVRLKGLAIIVLVATFAAWLISWLPYWLIAWMAIVDGDLVSREDYEGLWEPGAPSGGTGCRPSSPSPSWSRP